MRVVNIDNLEWIQVTVKELEDKAILILKPHINDLDWFEAEPVRHGRWIPTRPYMHSAKCTVCGNIWDLETPRCPSCGAKMDLEENHNGKD